MWLRIYRFMDNLLKYILYLMMSFIVFWFIFVFVMGNSKFLKPDLASEMSKNLPALSSVNPVEIGNKLTGTAIYTFGASTIDKWVYFDFSRGSVVSDVSSLNDVMNWDIAFRLAKIISNGGDTNKSGKVAVAKLDAADFDSVYEVPENTKFLKDVKLPHKMDTQNDNFEHWHSYKTSNHTIKPIENVYLIKTAEGNYAKMEILNYYCKIGEETIKGCYTIKYVYQGSGSKRFATETAPSKKTDR